MRAVVVDRTEEPALADVPEPVGRESSSMSSPAGSAARTSRSSTRGARRARTRPRGRGAKGRRMAGARSSITHRAARASGCAAGTSRTCEAFTPPTIRPGRLRRARPGDRGLGRAPRRARRRARHDGRAARLRAARRRAGAAGACPRRRPRLRRAALRARAARTAATTSSRSTPTRAGRARAPDGPVDAVVICAQGGVDTALDALAPGGTLLLFADAGAVPSGRRVPTRADGGRVALAPPRATCTQAVRCSASSSCRSRRCCHSIGSAKGSSAPDGGRPQGGARPVTLASARTRPKADARCRTQGIREGNPCRAVDGRSSEGTG